MHIIPDDAPEAAMAIRDNIPTWFAALNVLGLVPILAWPIVLFASIFMFDAPGDMFPRVLLWFTIIIYPVYIIGIVVLNFWLYRRQKSLAMLLLIFYWAFILIWLFDFF